jgi:hypothetical protein
MRQWRLREVGRSRGMGGGAQATGEAAAKRRIPLAEIVLFHNLPDQVLGQIEADGRLRRCRADDLLCDGG